MGIFLLSCLRTATSLSSISGGRPVWEYFNEEESCKSGFLRIENKSGATNLFVNHTDKKTGITQQFNVGFASFVIVIVNDSDTIEFVPAPTDFNVYLALTNIFPG